MSFHYLDIVVVILILFLGIKGAFRGLIKEFFAMVGIVAGVWLGSNLALKVGTLLADQVGINQNQSLIKLAGFAATFLVVWGVAMLAGMMLSKQVAKDEHRLADRINMAGGAAVGSIKIFLVFSIIAYAFSSTAAIQKWIDKNMANSAIYPVLISTGSYLIKLDIEAKAEEILEELEINVKD